MQYFPTVEAERNYVPVLKIDAPVSNHTPNPQLVEMIPHEQREQFIRELTEHMVDGFFEVHGLDTGCEYAYVLHHCESDDLQAPGQRNPHTHVVLPGTYCDTSEGWRELKVGYD